MAAAFTIAGFEAFDVHMQDLLDGNIDLKQFQGMAVCGGFSYGDVLGAGGGWSKTILYNNNVKDQFQQFFLSLYLETGKKFLPFPQLSDEKRLVG